MFRKLIDGVARAWAEMDGKDIDDTASQYYEGYSTEATELLTKSGLKSRIEAEGAVVEAAKVFIDSVDRVRVFATARNLDEMNKNFGALRRCIDECDDLAHNEKTNQED